MSLTVLDRALSLSPPSLCGACHCIPNPPKFKCLKDVPKYNWDPEEISFFKNVDFTGYYVGENVQPGPFFDCIPFSDIVNYDSGVPPVLIHGSLEAINSRLQKPLCESLGSSLSSFDPNEVCGFRYNFADQTTEHCPASYDLVTYQSRKTAKKDSAIITHDGSCGYCSSAHDLSAYLSFPDMLTPLLSCFFEDTGGAYPTTPGQLENIITCFQNDIGLTLACATIHFVNFLISDKFCGEICPKPGEPTEPANGPFPDCKLSECLQCDEDNSGPFFKNIAGRSRRNSGLLSSIARPCDKISDIVQKSCPKGKKYIRKKGKNNKGFKSKGKKKYFYIRKRRKRNKEDNVKMDLEAAVESFPEEKKVYTHKIGTGGRGTRDEKA